MNTQKDAQSSDAFEETTMETNLLELFHQDKPILMRTQNNMEQQQNKKNSPVSKNRITKTKTKVTELNSYTYYILSEEELYDNTNNKVKPDLGHYFEGWSGIPSKYQKKLSAKVCSSIDEAKQFHRHHLNYKFVYKKTISFVRGRKRVELNAININDK